MQNNYFEGIDQTDWIRNMILGLHVPVVLSNKQMVPAINLDNAATTPAFKPVANEVLRQLAYYGSIGRGKGQKSEHSSAVYTRGRDTVKKFIGADLSIYTTIYVNCTTDGMNKLASALVESKDDTVLTTRMEHHANDLPWRERCQVVYAEVDENGRLIADDVERLLREHGGRIKYVSITAASNVTGYVNDVHEIAKIAHRHNALIVVDGAQIVAHREFSMVGAEEGENIDFFVFSAHKMYSPFGGGAIVGLSQILDQHIPMFYGGGMVAAVCDSEVAYLEAPDSYEAGSPNYPGVVGMLKAIDILTCIGFEYIRWHELLLMKKTLDGLRKIPEVILYGDNDNIADRVGIIVFNIRGIRPETTANLLANYHAIAVRHAAFCAHPYVRRLTGCREADECPETQCTAPEGMVRVSFGVYNTEADIDCFLHTIKRIICSADHLDDTQQSMTDIHLPHDRG